MTLKKKQFRIVKDWLFIIPTIQIDLNSPQYKAKNFTLGFHFLVFHARLVWMKEKE